jgi:hypothetical protein
VVLDTELRTAVDAVCEASAASEVVGPDDDERKARVRELTKLLHPDRWVTHPPARKAAERAFARLQELLAEEAKASSPVFEVTSKRRTYTVNASDVIHGTVGNLYRVTYVRDPNEPPATRLKTGRLKLPRSVRDNDLVLAEAQALKKIWATGRRRTAYYPRLEDAFKYRDKSTRKDRQAIVTRQLDGFVSLEYVLKCYPRGLDARDVAWIWRRCLAAASLLAELDIVHGSLIPAHVLIHPVEHGVLFCGMTTSVPAGQTMKVTGGGSSSFYPPEVFKKEPVDHTTDLWTLHKTMERALANDAPRQFFSFIRGVTFDRQAVRPQDSRALLGEYDELLSRLYGARKFRVFPPVPGVTA